MIGQTAVLHLMMPETSAIIFADAADHWVRECVRRLLPDARFLRVRVAYKLVCSEPNTTAKTCFLAARQFKRRIFATTSFLSRLIFRWW